MQATNHDSEQGERRHTIAVIARRTGITQLVLRAWERRYGAVAPERTPTGRRLYSDQDLLKLMLLKRLTDGGHRISDVANLPLAELEELAGELPAEAPAPSAPPRSVTVDDLLGEALQAVADMDAVALEATLARAGVALSRPVLRRDLIEPLLVEIGERWRDGSLRIAHEHLATAIVRTFLASLNAGQKAAPGAPALVVGTPAGQLHELGALMAASRALEAGWQVFYLGPNLPAEELAAVALDKGARTILLSLVYPGADPGVDEQLRALRRMVGDEVRILAGGQAAASYMATLVGIDACVVESHDDMDKELSDFS